MGISFKTVFLLSILTLILIQQLESAKLHIPNEHASAQFRPHVGRMHIAALGKKLNPDSFRRIVEETAADLHLYELLEHRLQKEVEKIAGASHTALGTVLHIGGKTFKLIGTMTKFGGELAETAGYGIKTNGAVKVADGVNSIASFLNKFGTSSSVICVADNDKVAFYQQYDEKKKEKDEKTEKDKPIIPVTESYKPTTSVYVPTTTTAKYNTPVPTPYSIPSTTVKYIPPVTTPYSTTAVKYTTATSYVPPKTVKPTTTTMMPYMPDPSAYDSNSVNIPEGPAGSPLADYYPTPEEEDKEEE